MQAELEAICREYESSDDAGKLRLFRALVKENLELKARESERLKAEQEMRILYQQTLQERDGLRKENLQLKKEVSRLQDQNSLKGNTLFGRKSEKMDGLAEGTGQEDPLSEDAEETLAQPSRASGGAFSHHHKCRQKGKHAMDLSRLPQMTKYEWDEEELNRLFGKGQWRIVSWHKTVKKDYIPAIVYARTTYTPVLSVGLEHRMVSLPPKDVLLAGSDATSSLVAGIMTSKFALSLPLYRQEAALLQFDTVLSRQTMDNWVIRFSRDLFFKVYERMGELLKKSGCTQSDETTLLVIRDGRKAGRKSFMWVHITSELAECRPIAVFCYEPDRSTGHLRTFYDDYIGQIICDAYCAYHTFEEEKGGGVIICGCWMHARRRLVESLRLRKVEGMSKEAIDMLPEVRALRLIGEIYQEDQKYMGMTAEERLAGRKDTVAKKVQAYFDFLLSFDPDDPALPERMRDAIRYSLNQREYLERFLSSGTIPIDNGACERRIRPLAVGRNNWMFCTSTSGAEATAIMYTLVETAKMNGANVFYYLKYLLENAPSIDMPALSEKALDDLMPWSEAYKAYEANQKQEYVDLLLGQSDPEPTGKHLMNYMT